MPSNRRSRRRSDPKFRARGNSASVTVGALAAGSVATGPTDSFERHGYFISADLTVAKRSGTAGEGPLHVYLAHSDYTAAEIQEFIDNADGFGETDDLIAKEKSRRLIRYVGAFPGVDPDEVLNDGRPVRIRGRFRVGAGDAVNLAVYNTAGAQLTTGTIVTCRGRFYYRID